MTEFRTKVGTFFDISKFVNRQYIRTECRFLVFFCQFFRFFNFFNINLELNTPYLLSIWKPLLFSIFFYVCIFIYFLPLMYEKNLAGIALFGHSVFFCLR